LGFIAIRFYITGTKTVLPLISLETEPPWWKVILCCKNFKYCFLVYKIELPLWPRNVWVYERFI